MKTKTEKPVSKNFVIKGSAYNIRNQLVIKNKKLGKTPGGHRPNCGCC
jgi:hypothetical protein